MIETYKTLVHDRYQILKWIRSTGSQYVDVGSFDGNLKIVVDGILHPQIIPPGADSGLYSAAGTRNYGGASGNAQMIAIAASQANHIMLRVNGTWLSSGYNSYERHVIALEQLGDMTSLTVDDDMCVLANNHFDATGKDIYFFGVYHPATSQIYRGEIWSGENLLMRVFPAYDHFENKHGLYCTEGVFAGEFYAFNKEDGLTWEYIDPEDDVFIYKSYKRIIPTGTEGNSVKCYKAIVNTEI